MDSLLHSIRTCRHCEENLPCGPRPIIQAGVPCRLAILGQAPGSHVHKSGIPWNDPSGQTLRAWLDMDSEVFYDQTKVAHVPMGFCYPGKAKSGDLPPRPECAPLWHHRVLSEMKNLRVKIVIGAYAQKRYLDDFQSVTDSVKRWREFSPQIFPLPHPSPLNRRWLKVNPWFEQEVLPELRRVVRTALGA
jgi:uracil-DNA glycosylase